MVARQCRPLPLIPELGRQRQVDFFFLIQGQPGLQRELQDSRKYTDKSSLQPPHPPPPKNKQAEEGKISAAAGFGSGSAQIAAAKTAMEEIGRAHV